MFFKKIFTKDYRYYAEKGHKYLAEERYADARHAFSVALEKLSCDATRTTEIESELKDRFSLTGEKLAALNLTEAEHAVSCHDYIKARDHLELVFEMTAVTGIREMAETLADRINKADTDETSPEKSHDCSGCASPSTGLESEHVADHLSGQERFDLLVQTLPRELKDRYRALGDRFAEGYLLLHESQEDAGAKVMRELLKEGENDILLYEIALTKFKAGDAAECERLLKKAFILNNKNSLCCLGLVQILTDTGRLDDSLPILAHMIENELLIEQSLLFLGDVHKGLGNDNEAIESYTKAIAYPNAARAATERLIPLLNTHGRSKEASYLAKKYLKGCC